MSSSPAPAATASFICSWKSERFTGGVPVNVSENGPPHPTMLPAKKRRAPGTSPLLILPRASQQWLDHSVAVAHGRDAELQLQLCAFDGDIGEAVFVPRETLEARVERHMDVGIDEPGDEKLSSCVMIFAPLGIFVSAFEPTAVMRLPGDQHDAVRTGGPPLPSMMVAPVMAMIESGRAWAFEAALSVASAAARTSGRIHR